MLHAASMAVDASLTRTRGSGLYSALKGKVFKMECGLCVFLGHIVNTYRLK